MLSIVKSALLAGLTIAAVPAAASTVLTFDGPLNYPNPYVESGFEVEGVGFDLEFDNALHIDIAFGPNSNFRTIRRVDGMAFDVHSLDILSLFPSVSAGGLTDDPRDDVRFQGFDASGEVASTFASSQFGDMAKMFNSSFKGITYFLITGFNAGNVDLDLLRDVHFLIDNIVVSDSGDGDDPMSSVPAPASAALLVSALVVVGIRRKRKA